MVNAWLQIHVPVILVGRGFIAMFVFHCLGARMDFVTALHLIVFVTLDGLVLFVIFVSENIHMHV